MDFTNSNSPIKDEDEQVNSILDCYCPLRVTEESLPAHSSETNEEKDSAHNESTSTNPFKLIDDDFPDTYTFLENILKASQISSLEEKADNETQLTNPFHNAELVTEKVQESPLNSLPNLAPKRDKCDLEDNVIKDSSLQSFDDSTIQNYFETRKWKVDELILFRVSNIYDLTKFWIVPRFRELQLFMESLCNYYSKNKSNFKVKEVSSNLYCVVSCNHLYYRAIIVKLIPNDPHRVKVFLFDYGLIVLAFTDEVYYLHKKLYSTPQFAVRASLAYLAPKHSQTWTSLDVRMFDKLASSKVLVGRIANIDEDTKTLELCMGEIPPDGCNINYINEQLIVEDYARYIFDKRISPESSEYNLKVKDFYLFPTFDEIESGKVASSIYQFEELKNIIAFEVIYNHYCTSKN